MSTGTKTIVSWNVNGLRAVHRKGNLAEMFQMKPDILCLQETKSLPEQLPDELKEKSGYHTYFHSPTHKKGYSGVAIYSKEEPIKVSCETGKDWKDDQGRLIMAEYKDPVDDKASFTLINGYFPNGGGPPERLEYKLKFYDSFLKFINKLHGKLISQEKHPNIIFCGDLNVAHKPIDLARPKENEKHVGFLPEERAWMDKLIENGWVDVFRQFYPDKKDIYTYWDMKTFARERNVGWRIDYFFCSKEMLGRIKSIEILDNVFGSDHCPVKLILKD